MPTYVNDGSGRDPSLRVYLNLGTLAELRPGGAWPALAGRARDERLAADGFDGVQHADGDPADAGTSFGHCGSDRVDAPADADRVVATHRGFGHDCLTLHVGRGLEDDGDVDRLVGAVLAAADRHGLPVFIETHRATVTQDLWRTVQIAKRWPAVRFNGDFSHYYTGQEMVYGGLGMKCDFMTPIFDRVGFMHGRIGSPGCMQVSVGDGTGRPPAAHGVADFLADFRDLWTRAMLGFLRHAGPGDVLIFCPELLAGTHYYARLFPALGGEWVEESDRYQQALVYQRIARECFEAARRQLRGQAR